MIFKGLKSLERTFSAYPQLEPPPPRRTAQILIFMKGNILRGNLTDDLSNAYATLW